MVINLKMHLQVPIVVLGTQTDPDADGSREVTSEFALNWAQKEKGMRK